MNLHRQRLICGLLIALGTTSLAHSEDLVEFLNGSKVRGKILEIRKANREFDFEVLISNRTFKRTYPFSKVHAVTMNGKRYVLTERPAKSATVAAKTKRTRTEVNRLIKEQGSTPPDWLSAAPLNYPKSLDLAWPKKPKGKWNSQVNMGQYLWDVVNPNPGRWRGSVKLIYHCMGLHKTNNDLLTRDMQTLGGMYFRLFQDYPRAAYWLRKAGADKGSMQSILLAECYFRMGCKPMAMELLNHNRLPVGAIKLFGDMGMTKQALKWTDVYVRAGRPHEAHLLAADALRRAGQNEQAIGHYQKVLDAKQARNEAYDKRFRALARESIEAIRLFDLADVTKVSDGTYNATTTGYNGAIDVEVKVASGRIESVKVLKHREKQFYSALNDTPSQIIKKQSVRGIDATSRATITSQAIVNATAKALANRK